MSANKPERAQHTPGPWHVNAIRGNRIVGDETTGIPFDKLHISNHNCTVAIVYRGKDARLIAAAPALVEALRDTMKALDTYVDGPDTERERHVRRIARRALALVDGAE